MKLPSLHDLIQQNHRQHGASFGGVPDIGFGYGDSGRPEGGITVSKNPQPFGQGTPMSNSEYSQYLQSDNAPSPFRSALAYVGSSMAKLARPVRASLMGVVGGNPDLSELAAFVPFSDTMGLTDAKNEVSGRDILQHMGLVGERPELKDGVLPWLGDFALSMGADLVTDPLTPMLFGSGAAAKGVAPVAVDAAAGLGKAPQLARELATTAALQAGTPAGQAAKAGAEAAYQAAMRPAGLAEKVLGGLGLQEAAARMAAKRAEEAARIGDQVGTVNVGILTRPGTANEYGKMLGGYGQNALKDAAGKEIPLFPMRNSLRYSGYGPDTLPQQLRDLAQQANMVGPQLPGAIPTTPTQARMLKEIVDAAESGRSIPLQDAAKFMGVGIGGTPGTRILTELLTPPWGSVDRLRDLFADYGHLIPGMRIATGMFHGPSGGFGSAEGQQFSRRQMKPAIAAEEARLLPRTPENLQTLREAEQAVAARGGVGATQQEMDRYLADLIELKPEAGLAKGQWAVNNPMTPRVGPLGPGQVQGVQPLNIAPEQLAAARKVAADIKWRNRSVLREQNVLGIGVPKYDANVNYLHRAAAHAPGMPDFQRMEGGVAVPAGKAAGTHQRGLDYGRNILNDMILDPQISGANRLIRDDAQAAAYVLQQMGGAPGGISLANKSQKELLAEASGLADVFKRVDPVYARDQVKFFPHSPIEATNIYNSGAAMRMGTVKAVLNEMSLKAMEQDAIDQAVRAGTKFVGSHEDLSRVISKLNLSKEAEEYVRNQIAALKGVTPDLVDVSKHFLDESSIKTLQEAMKNFTPGSQLDSALKRAFDSVQGFFKTYITLPYPVYHFTNAMAGVVQNIITGHGGTEGYRRAWQLMKGEPVAGLAGFKQFAHTGSDAAATREVIDRLFGSRLMDKVGVNSGELSGSAAGAASKYISTNLPGDVGYFFGQEAAPWLGKGMNPLNWDWRNWQKGSWNPFAIRGGYNPEASTVGLGMGTATKSSFLPIRALENISEKSDQLNRLAHYFNALEKGASHEGAAASALATHYDYRQLSNFEREWMRRLFPFYSWSRMNVPFQANLMLTEPGRVGALVKGSNLLAKSAGDGFIPEFLRDKSAVPLGAAEDVTDPVSGRKSKQQKFMVLPSLPHEEALRWFSLPASGDTGNLFRQVLAATTPLIKAGVEQYTGEDILSQSDKDLRAQARWWEDPTMKALTYAARYTGASRIMNALNQLNDPAKTGRLSTPEALSGLFTGLTIRDVDMLRAKQLEQKDMTNAIVQGIPGVERQKSYHLPDEVLRAMPPREQAAALLAMRAAATEKERSHLNSLFTAIERAEQAKPELAKLEAVRQSGGFSTEGQRDRYNALLQAVYKIPQWKLEVAQLQHRQESRTGVPGVRIHGGPAYGSMIRNLKKGSPTVVE